MSGRHSRINGLIFAIIPLFMAGCAAVHVEHVAQEHAVNVATGDRGLAPDVVGPPVDTPPSSPEQIRVGMTRRAVATLCGDRYKRVSPDKSIMSFQKASLCGKYELWLYFEQSAFNESDNDKLGAIIVQRDYVVWM